MKTYEIVDVSRITCRDSNGKNGTINLIKPIRRAEALEIVELLRSGGSHYMHTKAWCGSTGGFI